MSEDTRTNEELAAAYAGGDRAAGAELAMKRMAGFVYRAVGVYSQQLRRLGVELEDAAQLGRMGVLEAALRFDPSLGFKFSTYCAPWAATYMRREIRRGMEGHMREYVAMARGEEVPARAAEIVRTREAIRMAASLQNPVAAFEDDGLLTLEDAVPADQPTPEELAASSERDRAVRDAMARVLRPRDREVLEHLYGIGGRREKTLEATGHEVRNEHGDRRRRGRPISRERVRQLAEKAMARLRPHLEDHR